MGTTQSQHADFQYIRGILENNTLLLKKIYKENLPAIISHVRNNKGTTDDAKDIFQEAILIIYEKAKQPQFELKSSFYSYLFGICKFLWLRQLKKKHRSEITLVGDKGLVDDDVEQLAEETEKYRLFQDVFKLLGEECRKVLQLFFDGISMQKIAKQLNYTPQYVKVKKFKCKEQLVKMVKKDVRWEELR